MDKEELFADLHALDMTLNVLPNPRTPWVGEQLPIQQRFSSLANWLKGLHIATCAVGHQVSARHAMPLQHSEDTIQNSLRKLNVIAD